MRLPVVRVLRRNRPMTCREVGRVLQRYLDGELDEHRSRLLAAHLEDCRRCGLEAATYQRIKSALAANQRPVPADALARLRQFGERLACGDDPRAG
jgi:anti-sigma factor RsiW